MTDQARGNGTAHVDELRRHIGVLENLADQDRAAIDEINGRLCAIEQEVGTIAVAVTKLALHHDKLAAALQAFAAAMSPPVPPPAPTSKPRRRAAN